MTLFDMTGKVAVVTGSSRGIGRAIAERMAEHGAKVVISSRKQQACDAVAKAINDKAGKQVALAVAANISTKDDLKNLTEETNRVFGTIDTLVCNAASNPYYGPQAGISDDQFRKISTTISSPITGSSASWRRRWWRARPARSPSSRRSAASRVRPCSAPMRFQRAAT